MSLKRIDTKPKENTVEKYLVKKIKELGGIPYKFTPSSRRNVADRLCVMPKRVVIFVECKRPGKEPTKAQYHELKVLRELDHWATWVDSRKRVDEVIEQIRYVLEHLHKINKIEEITFQKN